jgi:hypothetical protein
MPKQIAYFRGDNDALKGVAKVMGLDLVTINLRIDKNFYKDKVPVVFQIGGAKNDVEEKVRQLLYILFIPQYIDREIKIVSFFSPLQCYKKCSFLKYINFLHLPENSTFCAEPNQKHLYRDLLETLDTTGFQGYLDHFLTGHKNKTTIYEKFEERKRLYQSFVT